MQQAITPDELFQLVGSINPAYNESQSFGWVMSDPAIKGLTRASMTGYTKQEIANAMIDAGIDIKRFVDALEQYDNKRNERRTKRNNDR